MRLVRLLKAFTAEVAENAEKNICHGWSKKVASCLLLVAS